MTILGVAILIIIISTLLNTMNTNTIVKLHPWSFKLVHLQSLHSFGQAAMPPQVQAQLHNMVASSRLGCRNWQLSHCSCFKPTAVPRNTSTAILVPYSKRCRRERPLSQCHRLPAVRLQKSMTCNSLLAVFTRALQSYKGVGGPALTWIAWQAWRLGSDKSIAPRCKRYISDEVLHVAHAMRTQRGRSWRGVPGSACSSCCKGPGHGPL